MVKKRDLMAPSNCLRRSLRLSATGSGDSEPISSASESCRKPKKVKGDSGNCGSEAFDERSLTRSRRLSPAEVMADPGENNSPYTKVSVRRQITKKFS